MFGLFKRKRAQLVCQSEKVDLSEDKIGFGRARGEEENFIRNKTIAKIGKKILMTNLLITQDISREHGEFVWDNNLKKYRFRDFSKYGTKIENNKTSYIHNQEKVLNNKDKICFKRITLQILY